MDQSRITHSIDQSQINRSIKNHTFNRSIINQSLIHSLTHLLPLFRAGCFAVLRRHPVQQGDLRAQHGPALHLLRHEHHRAVRAPLRAHTHR